VASADDPAAIVDRHHHVTYPVAPAGTHGSSALSSSTPFASGNSSPAESRSGAGYLSASSHQSSFHNTHKKRHHRASPHSDSEVLNYYHGSRVHAPKTDHVTSDHVTARVDHVEVGDPLVSGGGGGGGGPGVGAGGVVAGGAVSGNGGADGVEEEDGELELGNLSGNNSEDEYYQNNASGEAIDGEDAEEVERVFEKQMKDQKGFFIRKMKEDGACLFRAIADQVYGDQDMHDSIRRLCMDYMTKNRDYFSQYITEEFDEYVARKRHPHCHGNYIEMQAISEMFNRPIEVYQVPRNTRQFFYRLEPINIFHGHMKTDNEPIRISYHRNVHYNSVVHPYKATIGVGLGLPALCPGLADRNLMQDATRVSERSHIEQTMFEDKIKETDWEATNEAIEEQVARESYLQWLQDQEKAARQGQKSHTRSATATSASCSSTSLSGIKNSSSGGGRSPRGGGATATSGGHSPSHSDASATLTPTTLASAIASSLSSRVSTSPRHSPPHRGLQSPGPSTSSTRTPPGGRSPNAAGSASLTGGGVESTTLSPLENAALRGNSGGGGGSTLPQDTSSTFLGFNDWVTEESESDIMAQVLAMSQREFFEAQMTPPYRQVASSSTRVNTPPPSSSRDAASEVNNQQGGGEPKVTGSPRETKKDKDM